MPNPQKETHIAVILDGDMQHSERDGNWYLFQTNDLTRFLSALIMGAAVSFPEAYEQMIIEGCNEELCTALNECLAEAFATLNEKLDAHTQALAEIKSLSEEVQQENKPVLPAPYDLAPSGDPCSTGGIWTGVLLLMEYINKTIVDIFEKQTASPPQDIFDLLAILFSAIPVLETLPYNEIWELTTWYFDNQEEDYLADYDLAWQEGVASELYCRISGNDCVLTPEMISDWLSWCRSYAPGNHAGDIFARFGDVAQAGLIQQLQSTFNELRGGQSITDFYRDLIGMFILGAQTPALPPEPIICSSYINFGFGGEWNVADGDRYTATYGQANAASGVSTSDGYGGVIESTEINLEAWRSVWRTDFSSGLVFLEINFVTPVTLTSVATRWSQMRTTGTYNRQRVEAFRSGGNPSVVWQRSKAVGGFDFSYDWHNNGFNAAAFAGLTLVTKIRFEHEITSPYLAKQALVGRIVFS